MVEKFTFVKKNLIKDEPIEDYNQDSFNLKQTVDNFWNYINSYEPPLVVGVFDNWGSGKSSFLNLVKKQDANFLTFHGWKYKGKEPLWKALTLKIAKEYGSKSWKKSIEEKLYLNKNQTNYPIGLIIIFLILSIIQLTLLIIGLKTENYMSGLGVGISVLTFGIAFLTMFSIKSTTKETLGFEQLHDLYENTISDINNSDIGKEKIYIIIEDLDRCLPKNAVNLLEDLKGFFKTEQKNNIIFILALDTNHLEVEIQNRFGNSEIIFNDYFDKIIDLPFYLPNKENNNRKFVLSLLDPQGKSKLEEDFNNLISVEPRIKDITFLDFIDNLLLSANKNTPRKIKKLFLDLDFAYQLSEYKKDLNSLILLSILVIREQYPIGYDILRRVIDFDKYKVQNAYLDENNFLKNRENRERHYKDISNELGLLNNNVEPKSTYNSENNIRYQRYLKINEFHYFLYYKLNSIFNLQNRDIIIPHKVATLKKYLNSIDYLFKAENKNDYVHWSTLERIQEEDIGGDETRYFLRCPNCKEGVIIREKDNTEGFKMSHVVPCKKCGFDKIDG